MKLFCVSYRRKLNVITYLLDIRYVIDDHLFNILSTLLGFPESSVGKESVCNAGDTGLIPGSGRSTGEGIGYPLQCSWASL